MGELQLNASYLESSNKKNISITNEDKECLQYLFANEAEEMRKEKQKLRDAALGNVSRILKQKNDATILYEITTKIYKACFGDLAKNDKMFSKSSDNNKCKSSIHDIVTGDALQSLIDKGLIDEKELQKQKNTKNSENNISGKEVISSHVMYRVLVATTIDCEVKEQDRAFIYDQRDQKVEGILKKIAQMTNEKELFDLECKLDEDDNGLSAKAELSGITQ